MVLTPGILSITSVTDTSASLESTDASSGTAPYTYQWYRSITPGFTPGPSNIISGATSLNIADFGLSPGTTYYFICSYTDTTTATVNSLELTVMTTGDTLTPGGLLLLGVFDTIINIAASPSSGGVPPISYQWYRSLTGPSFTPGPSNIISGATDTILNDTGLSPGTNYYYICSYTDTLMDTVYTAPLSVTTTGSILTAGILSLLSIGSNSAILMTTQATGGVGPYTLQWYRSNESSSFTPNNYNKLL